MLGADQRGELAEHQRGDGGQVTVALQETGQPRQVGLEPVLVLVGPGGLLEVGDHLVDVVLELGNLAGSVHGDGRVRSPAVTAVATAAIARTWVVGSRPGG